MIRHRDRRREHRAQGYEDARAVVLLNAPAAVDRTPPEQLRSLDPLDYIDGAWKFLRIAEGG